MKNFFKLLFVTVLAAVSIQAQSYYTTNNLAAGFHTISSTPAVLNSITVWTTNQTATIISLYDSFVVLTNSAYTNYITYQTNIVTTYITSTGVTNQMTNSLRYVGPNVVAASTNGTPVPLISFTIPGSAVANSATTPFTFTPPGGSALFATRLALSNDQAGASALINYRRR